MTEVYKNFNQYGYEILSLFIDHDRKIFKLYKGGTSPICKGIKKSKKFIYNLYEKYKNISVYKEESEVNLC